MFLLDMPLWIIFATFIGGTLLINIDIFTRKGRKLRYELATSRLNSSLGRLQGLKGIKLSKSISLTEKASYEGVVIVSATGGGKTTGIFYPNLLSNDFPESTIIVADPKGELFLNTSEYQKSIGRNTILFSPLNPEYTYQYNPLQNCKDKTEIRELAQNLLVNGALSLELQTGKKSGGIEWINMAVPLFATALMYCKNKPPMDTIPEALKLVINNSIEDLTVLFSNSSKDIQEQYNIFKSCAGSPRTAASIKITLSSNLSLFLDNKLINSIKHTEFTAKELREKPTVLYIMYPERKANYLSPFMSCFFSQMINQLMDYYSNDALPIFLMFDEFGNLGQIPNMETILSTCRSRKMSFTICLQEIIRLFGIYGRNNALSILNNLKTKCILPGISDIETLEYISKLCGITEIPVYSHSYGSTTSTTDGKTTTTNSNSTTESTSTKPLFTPDEVRRMKDYEDSILIIAHDKLPVRDYQNTYYLNEEYTSKVKTVNFINR